MSRDYVGGLALTPDSLYTLVAAADGVLGLLDMRKAGARLSYVSCGAPLRCLQTDGRYAAVGLETGQVCFRIPVACFCSKPCPYKHVITEYTFNSMIERVHKISVLQVMHIRVCR